MKHITRCAGARGAKARRCDTRVRSARQACETAGSRALTACRRTAASSRAAHRTQCDRRTHDRALVIYLVGLPIEEGAFMRRSYPLRPPHTVSVRRRDATPGGRRRWSSSPCSRRSSSTPRGRHFRTRITNSVRISRRSTLPVLASPATPAQHAWFGPQPALVAGVPAVLTGAADPSVPWPLPLHLLLLPRRLLQGVLGRPAGLLRRRAAQRLSRRELVPADPAERPPLLLLRRGDLHLPPRPTTSGWRCGSPIRRRAEGVRHRRRHASSCWSTSSCSPATRSAATRAGTSSADAWTRCRSRRS